MLLATVQVLAIGILVGDTYLVERETTRAESLLRMHRSRKARDAGVAKGSRTEPFTPSGSSQLLYP